MTKGAVKPQTHTYEHECYLLPPIDHLVMVLGSSVDFGTSTMHIYQLRNYFN